MLVSHSPKPFLHRSAYNRCHSGLTGRSCAIMYSLLGSNSNCKVFVNGSLSRLRVVIHVSLNSILERRQRMTRLNTAFSFSTNSTTPKSYNPRKAVASSVRIDVRSSLLCGGIPAASQRQVLRTCESWVTKQASFPAHRRSSTMQTLFHRGYTEKHAPHAPEQSRQLQTNKVSRQRVNAETCRDIAIHGQMSWGYEKGRWGRTAKGWLWRFLAETGTSLAKSDGTSW